MLSSFRIRIENIVPSAFPIVKMENKTPKTSPFPCTTWTPHVIQQCRTSPNRSSDGWGTVPHLRRKVPIGYNGAPKIRPKSTPSRRPIDNPHYPPHSWTRPTYDAKRHSNPIRRFSRMHWTDRRTDAQTDRSSTGKFDHYRALRL